MKNSRCRETKRNGRTIEVKQNIIIMNNNREKVVERDKVCST